MGHHRKRSRRHRGQKRNITQRKSQTSHKSVENIPQTPYQPINVEKIPHYKSFSHSDFDDAAINTIEKCKDIINNNDDSYKKITKLREILNIYTPQRRLLQSTPQSSREDVSPTSGQEQLANGL